MLDVYEIKYVNPYGEEEVEIVEGEALKNVEVSIINENGGNVLSVTKLNVLDHK